jgi:putative phosphonate metabolism protein
LRYAIYFTPPETDALTRCGAQWLGRDAFQDVRLDVPTERSVLVKTPARYGFHATLKAPFELASDVSAEELQRDFREFCSQNSSVLLPELDVQYTGNSFVLGLSKQSDKLAALAAEIVQHFDIYRAPLSQSDIERRNPARLSQSQRANLELWGYPHVMDDFRFHMTLTGPVPADQQDQIAQALSAHFAQFIDTQQIVSGLGLFIEPARGDDLRVLDWQPLKGGDLT